MLNAMTLDYRSATGLLAPCESRNESIGSAQMGAFANLVFRVLRPSQERTWAEGCARPPPYRRRRQRGTTQPSGGSLAWLDDVSQDVMKVVAAGAPSLEDLLAELVLRQIHQLDRPENRDGNDGNDDTCGQDSKHTL